MITTVPWHPRMKEFYSALVIKRTDVEEIELIKSKYMLARSGELRWTLRNQFF